MSEENIDAVETQRKLANALNSIVVRRLAIEGMEEQVEDYLNDLVAIYAETGNKKSKGDVKILAEVYLDAEKAKKEEESKIDKSRRKITLMESFKEELSVLARYRLADPELSAEEYLDLNQ